MAVAKGISEGRRWPSELGCSGLVCLDWGSPGRREPFLGVPSRHNFGEVRALAIVGGVVACSTVHAAGTFIGCLGTYTSESKCGLLS